MRPPRRAGVALLLRPSPRVRLAVLVAALAVLFAVFAVRGVLSPGEVRGFIEPLGAIAPVAFVLVSVAFNLVLVPGALLATASGLIFGPLLGTPLAILAATLSALAAATIARAVGRAGVEQVSGRRMTAVGAWLERHGFAAVVTARLAPGVPDAPVSYAAGLAGVRRRDLAAGTIVGGAPRAFAYAALGGSLTNLSSPLAVVGLVVLIATGLAGVEAVRRTVRRSGSARAALEELRARRR